MKKIMSILLSALMVFSMTAAMAETASKQVTGTIVEMNEDGSFLVEQLEDGVKVHVNVPDGVNYDADWTLHEGDVVIVSYNGVMTRSDPGQINAESIRSATIEGHVVEAGNEQNRVLIDSQEFGQVFATLPDSVKAEDYQDKYVRIYFNGVMALSLPGQVSALTIAEVFMETGEVTDIQKDYFIMQWGESELHVNFDEYTKVIHSFDVGDEVAVYYNGIMTRSMPGQVYALVIANEIVLD